MQALKRFFLIASSLAALAAAFAVLALRPLPDQATDAAPAVLPAADSKPAVDPPETPSRAVAPVSRDVTPPSVTNLPVGDTPLVRVPPRDPPPEPTRDSGPVLLHQPVAVDAGTIRIGDGTVQLSGVGAVPLEEECGSGAGAWPCGMRSRTALRSFLRARSILCEAPEDFGSREETVETACEIRGVDIGDWVVRNGWGTAANERYADAEAEARAEGRGIWRGR